MTKDANLIGKPASYEGRRSLRSRKDKLGLLWLLTAWEKRSCAAAWEHFA